MTEQHQAYELRLPGRVVCADQGPEQLARVRRALAQFGYD